MEKGENMIDILVGLFILLVTSEKKEPQHPEEYYPFMYDHFNKESKGGINEGGENHE